MNGWIAAICGLLLVAGSYLIFCGLTCEDKPLRLGKFQKTLNSVSFLFKKHKFSILSAVFAGILGYLYTGLALILFIVPIAVIGIPWLLGVPKNQDIDMLVALDRWMHSIESSLLTGKSVQDSIRDNYRHAPVILSSSISRLLFRLDNKWSVNRAFLAMADELDSPDADCVLVALSLAAQRGGTGAVATLKALSESNLDKLKAIREIKTERDKPRVVVRQITIISFILLIGFFVVGKNFFQPYKSIAGQLILSCLIAAYIGSLVMLRKLANPEKRKRFLTKGMRM